MEEKETKNDAKFIEGYDIGYKIGYANAENKHLEKASGMDVAISWTPLFILLIGLFFIMRISAKKTNQYVSKELEMAQESVRLLKEISQKLDKR